MSKKKKSTALHKRHVLAHKNWWKENFKFGFTTGLDLGLNEVDDDEEPLHCYTAGLLAKFGAPYHHFNLIFGAKYTWFNVWQYYDWDWVSVGGGISIPLELRYNVLNTDSNHNFYVGCGTDYYCAFFERQGFDKAFANNSIAIYPQIGYISRFVDFSVCWKTYIRGPFKKELVNNDQSFNGKNLLDFRLSFYF